jgi:uncharacterized membrane protein HdeD (DUF308 family)
MATTESLDPHRLGAAVAQSVRDHWGLFIFEGIVLVILGMLAIIVPVIASLAATILFGWLLLLSGILGLVTSFRARHAPGFVWSLLSAIVAIVAGALLLRWPVTGTFSLTAVLIAFLAAEGVVSIFYSLEHRRALSGRWGWMLASGIIDLALAAILFAGLPGTALWAIGLLLGINLVFGGWSLIAMALAAHAQQKSPESSGAPAPSH